MSEDEIKTIIRETLAEERRLANDTEDAMVLKAVSAILTSFGIEEDDRKEFKADLMHLRRWRKSVEQAQTATFKAVVSAIAAGLIGAVWLGFKTVLAVKGGG
ncbi:hypothetical protein ACKWRH_21690 [Bradyrhizobium sp. Pa8]|uniref:hypothetical protein n=1 Tax=Bradyrhizobium sp. Pa8 TaxID=3386552 RepID=UPI00403F5793